MAKRATARRTRNLAIAISLEGVNNGGRRERIWNECRGWGNGAYK